MKKLLLILVAVILVGAGCFNKGGEEIIPVVDGTEYQSRDFGFSLRYPDEMEVNERKQSNWAFTYSGMEVDFFLSLRDIVREDKATSLVYFYAVDEISTNDFTQKLEEAIEGTEIVSTEKVERGDFKMVKVVNTTQIEEDKTHYLFNRNGKTIIASVFLGEEELVEPVMHTFKEFE